MTDKEAKQVLRLYRPDTADAADPEVVAALALTQSQPQLRAWFETHCAVQASLRAHFRGINVPEGLKGQIISERPVGNRMTWQRLTYLTAAAAVIAFIISVVAVWWGPTTNPSHKVTFDIYRGRMVSTLLRQYGMSLESPDPAKIRAHLAENHAPADYVLPQALEAATPAGCGVLYWEEKRVSMVCFRTKRPLKHGEKADLFLFVVDRKAVPDAPSGAPQIAEVNTLLTATWTQGEKVFVLALQGEESLLREYLN